VFCVCVLECTCFSFPDSGSGRLSIYHTLGCAHGKAAHVSQGHLECWFTKSVCCSVYWMYLRYTLHSITLICWMKERLNASTFFWRCKVYSSASFPATPSSLLCRQKTLFLGILSCYLTFLQKHKYEIPLSWQNGLWLKITNNHIWPWVSTRES
jgi:hypothetical protein